MQNDRQKKIMQVSAVGIIVNIFLAVLKSILGVLTGSMAIASDAINNLTDSSSALITILGTKFAQKQPDKKHPFGYGRIEYLTSMLIGIIVLVTGVEMTLQSVKGIIHPEEVSYSWIPLIILFLTIFVKIILGTYTQGAGKKLDSGALVASGADAKNDAIISAVALLSAVIYIMTNISIDAYAGAIISLFIIKTGFDVIQETLGQILGERGNQELAHQIYEKVQQENHILGVHDLILKCARHGTNLASESLVTGIYRQV